MDDLQLEQEALQEARKRKKDFAREKVDSIAGEDCPVSVFMVGQEAVYFDVKDIDALLGRKYTSSELKALVEMARAEGDHEYGPKQ